MNTYIIKEALIETVINSYLVEATSGEEAINFHNNGKGKLINSKYIDTETEIIDIRKL